VLRDGAPLGKVAARRTRTFRGLKPGVAHLVASDRDGRVLAEDRRALRPAGLSRWEVSAPACTLEVVNRSPQGHTLLVAGRRSQTVAPAARLRFDRLAPGALRVEARPMAGRGPVQRAELGCTPGAALRWEILPPPPPAAPRPATLVVTNPYRVPLSLRVAGRNEGKVPARGKRKLRGLKPGRRRVEVETPAGQQATTRIQLAPGSRQRWEPRLPKRGALVVANFGPRPVEVRRGGRRLGRVDPGARRRFDDLASGTKRLRATTPRGREVAAERHTLRTGAVAVWEVRFAPAPGRVVIRNGSGRRVQVLRSGEPLGPIADGAEVAFEVPRGTWTFEARGVGRRRRVLARKELRVRRRPVRWEIPLVLERLEVRNEASEALKLRVDGRKEGRLRPGATWSRDLGPGRHELVGVGVETREKYRLEVRLRAGRPAKVSFQRRRGPLTVINTGTQALRVELDGRRLGVVAPRSEKTWRALDVGRHELVCTGKVDRRRDERRVVIVSGGLRVRVGISPARVRPPASPRRLKKVVRPPKPRR